MNYFEVKDGHFTHDLKLGFDYNIFNHPRIFYWSRSVDCSQWSHEGQVSIDISEIPPSIILLSIVNSTSSGFDLCIPLDMSYPEFFLRLAEQFASGYEKATEYNPRNPISNFLFNKEALDLDPIHQTGMIPDRMKWNNYLNHHHALYIYDGHCTRSMQGIVSAAQDFWNLIRS